ncbi:MULTISPECIES: MFS transporter [unclassified Frankia]|uniref:MFS transporter n=1 Tax=unclassified Frankia TaxID=2632575 RepID=UPI0019315382|nr:MULTISPECIES: MFS transporter [unclassified Frankia]
MAVADGAGREVTGGGSGWWSRNLKVLSAVSFLQDSASELLYPILPIFLTVTLGAPVAVVGVVEGLAEGAASVTKLAAGRLADRAGRRRMVAVGYGLAAAGKVLIAVALVWPVVLAGRCVDRLGKGVRGAPRDTLLVEGVPVAARGRAFGFHRSMDTAGAVVGPLLGLAGYELLHHRLRPLLVIAVIPAVASVVLVAAVRERSRPGPAALGGRAVSGAVAGSTEGVVVAALPGSYWRVVGALTAFSVVNFPDALLLLRVKALGLSVAWVIVAYVVYNGAYAALSYPAGALADRLGPRRIYGMGLGCFAVGYLGLGLAASSGWVWPLLIVYGGFTACTDGVGKAWVSRLVAAGQQGRAQGTFQGLTGAGVLLAGVWAGLAWGGSGRVPLLVSGMIGVVLAVAVLAWRRG